MSFRLGDRHSPFQVDRYNALTQEASSANFAWANSLVPWAVCNIRKLQKQYGWPVAI